MIRNTLKTRYLGTYCISKSDLRVHESWLTWPYVGWRRRFTLAVPGLYLCHLGKVQQQFIAMRVDVAGQWTEICLQLIGIDDKDDKVGKKKVATSLEVCLRRAHQLTPATTPGPPVAV